MDRWLWAVSADLNRKQRDAVEMRLKLILPKVELNKYEYPKMPSPESGEWRGTA
jgi:hypothetical protein